MSYSKSMLLSTALAVVLCTSAHAANSIVIESRTFSPNQPNCSVGVFLTNDIAIVSIDLVVELRSVSGGAYFFPPEPQSNLLARQIGQRLDHSPLGSQNPSGGWLPSITTVRFLETPLTVGCSGPESHTWAGNSTSLTGTSPDGIYYFVMSDGSDESVPWDLDLEPGSDPASRHSASLLFQFAANGNHGCFEIDMACYSPEKHTSFINRSSDPVPVAFTKGTICIDPSCYHCYCLGNPHECSRGDRDIVDVLTVVNVAIRGMASVPDPSAVCPYSATDVNCDGVSSVIDVIKMVDVAFRAGDPAMVFCDPCE